MKGFIEVEDSRTHKQVLIALHTIDHVCSNEIYFNKGGRLDVEEDYYTVLDMIEKASEVE